MESEMANAIIIVIVLVAVAIAIKYSIQHFKGEGGCCGGGGKAKLIKPKKLDKVVAIKVIKIDGMTCDHCSARIQNALNSMGDVNAKVNRSRNCAVVKLGREIDDAEIEAVITDLGYTVMK